MLMGVLKSFRPARCKVKQQVAVKMPNAKYRSRKTLWGTIKVSSLVSLSLRLLFRTSCPFNLELWLQKPKAFDPFGADRGSVKLDDFKAINSSEIV